MTELAQKLFDKAVEGVYWQGEQSADGRGGCLYRGPGGTKCAVGQLIEDNEFDEEVNGHGISNKRVQETLCKSMGITFEEFNEDIFGLLDMLQRTHDNLTNCKDQPQAFRSAWLRKANKIAEEHGLTPWLSPKEVQLDLPL